ncbi:MAG: YIP1 family protein [Ignavibacteria bacterium]|nr:YIP1 family protein [Ignavibacteria bacterium]
MEEKNSENHLKDSQIQNVSSISISDAMSGVFTEPGETFSEISKSDKRNFWLLPLVITLVVTLISSLLVMNDEELTSSIREKQKKAMEEQFEEMVKKGTITKQEADEQMERNEKMFSGTMFIIFGLIGALFSTMIFFFLKSLIYFGVLKLLKGIVSFTSVMNVVGLAGLISSVQIIVNTVLAIFTGKISTNIGPAFFLSAESFSKPVYVLLSSIDVITFWYLGILGIGLARVSSLKTSTIMIAVILLWLVWVLLMAFGPFSFFSGA